MIPDDAANNPYPYGWLNWRCDQPARFMRKHSKSIVCFLKYFINYIGVQRFRVTFLSESNRTEAISKYFFSSVTSVSRSKFTPLNAFVYQLYGRSEVQGYLVSIEAGGEIHFFCLSAFSFELYCIIRLVPGTLPACP